MVHREVTLSINDYIFSQPVQIIEVVVIVIVVVVVVAVDNADEVDDGVDGDDRKGQKTCRLCHLFHFYDKVCLLIYIFQSIYVSIFKEDYFEARFIFEFSCQSPLQRTSSLNVCIFLSIAKQNMQIFKHMQGVQE